jgi:isoquinoline 1-oxidoreductase alpha subunit
MTTFNFTVNDTPRTVDADPDTPLLWVLRDDLNLTGVKYGCGIGQCGCCTVHIDGAATRSCSVAVSTVDGSKITTIEGLEKIMPKLQEAWIAEQTPQCGYCQSGQLMSAAILLQKHPNPTDAEIDQAMNGNLCRCGTYGRIRRAIRRAAGAAA